MVSKIHIAFQFLFLLTSSMVCGQQAEIIKSLRIHTLEDLGPLIFDRNVKKNINGDYYVIVSSHEDDIYIDDEVFPNPSIPSQYQTEDDKNGYLLLLKINKDLELQKVVNIKNVSLYNIKIAVSENKIVIGFMQENHVQIDDTILPFDGEQDKPTIVSFDSNLENLKELFVPNFNGFLGEMALTDSLLYIEGTFEFGYQEFKYGNTILKNYYSTDEVSQDTTFGQSTPFIVQYDLIEETVKRAWKFGSLGSEYLIGFNLDNENNLVIHGTSETTKWVTFDGIDFTDVKSYETGFIVKYNPLGEVVFGNLFTEWKNVIPVHVYLDHGDTYFSFSYRGDSINIDGVDIINREMDGSFADGTYFLCRFNSEGQLIWVSSLNPIARNYRGINIIGTASELIFSGELVEGIKLEIQDQTYVHETKMNLIYTLDKETGTVLSHAISNAEHKDVQFNCLHQDMGDNIYLMYQTVSEHNLWGNDFDTWYLGGFWDTRSIDHYFLKLDMAFLTDVHDLPQNMHLMEVYPNPVQQNGFINIDIADDQNGNWALYSSFGNVVKKGTFKNQERITINILNLQKGQYILHLNNGEEMQNEIVIIL